MKRIWKFQIKTLSDEVTLSVPGTPQWLSVGEQDGTLCLWALIEDRDERRTIVLRIVGTGHPIEDAHTLQYIGMTQVRYAGGTGVWHVFEKR